MGDEEQEPGTLRATGRGSRKVDQTVSDGADHRWSASEKKVLSDTIRDRVVSRLSDMHPPKRSSGSAAELAVERMETVRKRYRDLPKFDKALSYADDLRLALLDPDPKFHRELAEQLSKEGIPILTASCVLYGPIASEFGDMWCEDKVDFIQVAVASSRLSIMVSHMARSRERQGNGIKGDRSILLARTRGGNHTLGLAMVSACFADAGWKVNGGPELEAGDELYNELNRNNYRFLGLSVSMTSDAEDCAITLSTAKRYSRNPSLHTVLGGPAIAAAPDIFTETGASLMVTSARDAVEGVEHIIR